MSAAAVPPFPRLAIVMPDEGERLLALGDHLRLLVTGADTNGAFTLIEQASPAGTAVPRHYHTQEFEMFHVLEGTVRYTVNGEVIEAGAGTTISIPPGVVHSFEFVTDARTHITCVPAGIEDMFQELASLPLGPINFQNVTSICAKYGVHFVA